MGLRLTEEQYAALTKKRGQDIADHLRDAVESIIAGSGEISEEEEQILLFSWASVAVGKYPELSMLFHIPNGGSRSKAEAGRFKAMGVKKGVPDLFLPVPRGGFNGLFIELKREHGGALSQDQRDWLDDLSARGYKAVMCHGWAAAREALIEYLREEGDAMKKII